jgi:hypothetical protein
MSWHPFDKIKAERHGTLGLPDPKPGARIGIKPKAQAGANPTALDRLQELVAKAKDDIAGISTVGERAEYKRRALPEMFPLVKIYRDSRSMEPNMDVIMVMIWLFDADIMDEAMNLAFYLIGQGNQHMPERFARNIETFVADFIYDWAAERLNIDQSAEPYLSTVIRVSDEQQWRLNFIVRGKLYAIAAKHALCEERYIDCVRLCDKAEYYNPQRAGVKSTRLKAQDHMGNGNMNKPGVSALSNKSAAH